MNKNRDYFKKINTKYTISNDNFYDVFFCMLVFKPCRAVYRKKTENVSRSVLNIENKNLE